MRRTLLYFKVVFLLLALGGASSSNAVTSGDHNLLDSSALDFTVNVSEQTTNEDENSIAAKTDLFFIELFVSTAQYSPLLTKTRNCTGRPFARAPPVNFSA